MKKVYLLMLGMACAFATKAQYVSLNSDELGKLKQLLATDQSAKHQYESFQRSADAALNETPNPIDTIHTEGRLKGDPQKTATGAALADMRKMYSLALVYKLSGDKKYFDKAVAYLTAWATVNKANGDPIDDTNLDPAVEAYDLIKTEIVPADQKLIVKWLLETGFAEMRKMKPGRESSYNNWNSHRLKVIGEIAYAIDDKHFQQYTIDGLKLQISKNLLPDGSSVDFKLRDALHYHVYDLEPLIKLCIILKRATGVDYYNYVSPEQTSIEKSTKWLLPYLKGEKTHGEFVNSSVSFDKKRASNGEAEYKAGHLFDPKNGVGALLQADYFEPDATNLIAKLKNSSENFPDWVLVLNKVKQ